ncbi:MAG: hypothetical protein IT306_16325 [Chloroflexi bacterium]|nr:hypothetical protein [Chloroflexota bacterium]
MSAVAPNHPGVLSARFVSPTRVKRMSRALLLVLGLLALLPPAYLLQTGGALTTGYEIQKLERERSAWVNRNQQLEAEIAKARSLAWIEHEAVHRMGMQRPAQAMSVRMDTAPAPRESRLLRRAAEPLPAQPVKDGPSWSAALAAVAEKLTRGD